MDFLTVLGFLGGLAALVLGAYSLVEGGVKVARILGIPAVVVGLTVVAFGTSAPEFFVSLVGALRGSTALVLGNVMGSNVANLGLILAAAGLLRPVVVDRDLARREILLMGLATLVFGLLVWDGGLSRPDAALLAAGFVAFMSWTFLRKRSGADPDPADAAGSIESGKKAGATRDWRGIALGSLQIVVGIAALAAGGKLITDSAVVMAKALGVSETVIGLTMVAVGTSLPELATTVMAAVRREGDLALGNIFGSNVFNLLGVAGPVGLVHPLQADMRGPTLSLLGWGVARFQFQVLTVVGVTLMVMVMASTGGGRFGRWRGGVLLVVYGLIMASWMI